MLIDKAGISLEQVEKDCELENGTLLEWCKTVPYLDDAARVAAYFDVPIGHFLTGEQWRSCYVEVKRMSNSEIIKKTFSIIESTRIDFGMSWQQLVDLLGCFDEATIAQWKNGDATNLGALLQVACALEVDDAKLNFDVTVEHKRIELSEYESLIISRLRKAGFSKTFEILMSLMD